MDDQNSRQQRRGLVDRANSAFTTGRRIYKLTSKARTAGILAANPGVWAVIGGVALIVLIVFAITFSTGEAANLPTDTEQSGISEPPPAGSSVRQAIIDRFGIIMNGFDERHLSAAWEKMTETSNTKFPSLVRGATIQAVSGNSSSQVGCSGGVSLNLAQHEPLPFFKYILTHELGHFIRNCQKATISKYGEHINAYSREGAVSFYASNANLCTGSDNYSEDYADMISYYLNPSAGFSTTTCGGRSPASPPNPLHVAPIKTLHYNVAREILTQ